MAHRTKGSAAVKVGDTRSDEAIQLIASATEYEAGVVVLNHPRHGVVVIRREADGVWRVTKVARP